MGGGSYKGNSRGKPYGVMLLLAFGAALLGVLVIHKLRERRIFSLLLQDKDSQLLSLQLLLQREEEYTREMKRKTEEMKAKIYLLRDQKMETDRRILEMQSTIDSLKDERKVMESALVEKQNEIKLHTQSSMYLGKENPRTTSLMGNLDQKEAETEDLKQNQPNMRSVTADAQSNTELADGDGEEGRASSQSINDHKSETSTRVNVNDNASTALINGENTTRRREGIAGNADWSVEAKEGRLKMQGNSVERLNESGPRKEGTTGKEIFDDGQRNKNEHSQVNSTLDSRGENEIANASGGVGSGVVKVSQTGNAGRNPVNGEEHRVDRDGQIGLENPQQNEENSRDGAKSGMKNKTRSYPSRVQLKRTIGKRWKILAKNRRLEGNKYYESNVAEGVRKRRIYRDDENDIRDTEGATTPNKSVTDGREVMGVNKPAEETMSDNFSDAKLLEPQNSEDTVDQNNKLILDKPNHLHWESGKVQISQTRLQLMSGSLESNTNDVRSENKTENVNEVEENEGQDTNSIEENKKMNIEADAVRKNERSEEMEGRDIEHEATIDLYKDPNSDMGEEPEFQAIIN